MMWQLIRPKTLFYYANIKNVLSVHTSSRNLLNSHIQAKSWKLILSTYIWVIYYSPQTPHIGSMWVCLVIEATKDITMFVFGFNKSTDAILLKGNNRRRPISTFDVNWLVACMGMSVFTKTYWCLWAENHSSLFDGDMW